MTSAEKNHPEHIDGRLRLSEKARITLAEFYARDRRQAESHALAMARSIAIQASHFLLRRAVADRLRAIPVQLAGCRRANPTAPAPDRCL